MALVQDNKTKLFLTSQSGTWGSKAEAIRLRHRFPVEQAVRYAQILREKGYDVTAVLDSGGSCEPQSQTAESVNETIDYGYCDWRIDVQKVQAGYMHRWVDSDTRQQFQIIESTPQRVFEKLRDVQDIFSERHIAELPHTAPPQPAVNQPEQPAYVATAKPLRPGDVAQYAVNEQPVYRPYWNPNAEAQAAAQRPEVGFAEWERTSSVAALKKRYETDQAFARWYDGVGTPATNRQ
ncbi:MAG: hypothetical protein WCC97_08465 [Candidatus Acidiferrales bacterium]